MTRLRPLLLVCVVLACASCVLAGRLSKLAEEAGGSVDATAAGRSGPSGPSPPGPATPTTGPATGNANNNGSTVSEQGGHGVPPIGGDVDDGTNITAFDNANNSIEVSATGSAEIRSDFVAVSIAIFKREFACGYEMSPTTAAVSSAKVAKIQRSVAAAHGRDADTADRASVEEALASVAEELNDAFASTMATPAATPVATPVTTPAAPAPSVDPSTKCSYPPSQKELRKTLLELETELVEKAGEVLDFLKKEQKRKNVRKIHDLGLFINPIYDYGCGSSGYCNFLSPNIVGFEGRVRITFEATVGAAQDVIDGAIKAGANQLESAVNVLSEKLLFRGALQAGFQAIQATTLAARLATIAVGIGLSADFRRHHKDWSDQAAAMSSKDWSNAEEDDDNDGPGSVASNIADSFDLQLVKLKCELVSPMQNQIGPNHFNYESAQAMTLQSMDGSKNRAPYFRATNVQVDVRCELKVHVAGAAEVKKHKDGKDGHGPLA